MSQRALLGPCSSRLNGVMQFTEGISLPLPSLFRVAKYLAGVRRRVWVASRLFVSVRNCARVSGIRRTYPVFLDFARLDNLSREIDENEGGWWMMLDVDLARVNYHAILIFPFREYYYLCWRIFVVGKNLFDIVSFKLE